MLACDSGRNIGNLSIQAAAEGDPWDAFFIRDVIMLDVR